MRFALFIFLGWALLILQSTVVSFALNGWPQPDLLLVLMVFVALTQPLKVSLPIALGYGFLLDLFVGGVHGAYLFQYATLVFLAQPLGGRLLMGAPLVQGGILFIFTGLGDIELMVAARLLGVPEAAVGAGGVAMLLRGFMNAAIAVVVFPYLVRIHERLWAKGRRITLQMR